MLEVLYVLTWGGTEEAPQDSKMIRVVPRVLD